LKMGVFDFLGPSFMSGLYETVKVYGGIGIILFVIGLIGMFFIYYLKFNIKVFIARYYSEGRFIWKTDKARRKRTKQGIEEFKMFKRNRTFKPPTRIHRLQKGLFPTDFIFLVEDVYGDFHEMEVDSGINTIKPVSHDIMLWKINESNKAWEAYKKADDGFWSKHGPLIATMAGFAILFVMVIVILYYMKDVSQAFQNAAGSLSNMGQPIPQG